MAESLNIKITATDSSAAAFASLNRNMNAVSSGFQRLTASISGFTRGAVGVVLAQSLTEGIGQVVRYADSWSLMQNRLRSAGLSFEQTAAAQTKISEIAKNTRSDLTETGNLYARLAFATETMGMKQEDVAKMTETLSKAFKMSGKTALESQSAVTQFSQALASGVLQGDELRSIRENAPEVARAIADAMGVSVGELKKLGEQGRITADVMVEAILSAAPKIEERFMQTRKTYADQFQYMSNAVQEFIGREDDMMRKHIESMQGIGMTGNVMIDNYTSAEEVTKSIQSEIDKLTDQINRGNEELNKLQQQISEAPGGSDLFTQLTFEANMFKEAINESNAQLDTLQKKLKDTVAQAPALPAAREIFSNQTVLGLSPYSTSEADQIYKTKEQLKELTAEKNRYIQSQRDSLLKTKEQTLAEQIYAEAAKAGKLATGFTMADAEKLAIEKIRHDENATSAKKHADEIQNLIQKYREAADPLLVYREDLAKIEAAFKRGEISAATYAEAVANIKTAMEKAAENADPLKKQTEELTRAFEGFGRRAADAIADFVVDGKGNFSDLIKSMIKDLISFMVYQNMMKPLFSGLGQGFDLSSLFGSFLGLSAKASGGSVSSGSPYLVGEKGPELFIPNRSGSIAPNGLGGGGGNVSVNIINNSNAQATATETMDGRGNRKIDVVIGDVVAKEIGRIGSSVNQSIRNTFQTSPALVGR